MVIEHKIEGCDHILTTDYSKHFHKSWLEFEDVKILLNSDYMSNLNFYMKQSYLACNSVYPRMTENIFKAFKLTALTDIRVVIIGDEPFTNVYSNGLAFGQMRSPSSLIPRESYVLRKLAEKAYFDRENVIFDSTLEDWARQGVLLLNTSLISELASPMKHRRAFKNFTRQIIKIISDCLADVIFVFTNRKQEELFGKYIEQAYHHIISVEKLTEDTDVLDEINGLILESVGGDEVINWI